MKLKPAVLAIALTGVLGASASAWAADVIKIGEINSYKAQPVFLDAYKRGMTLALDEINGAGGVNGKKLEVITRDDNANPGDAVRLADELLSREGVDLIAGSFLSHVGLALADYAQQRKVFYLGTEPLTDKIVWENGNRYTYRMRTSTYMQTAMLAAEAAKLKKKKWALIYPNYEFGQSSVATFKKLLKQAQPDVEFVIEQAPPLGKVDAGSVVQAVADAKPDAIFNTLFGPDLAKFVREGNTRGLFKSVQVVSMLTGEPEYLDPLRAETPDGWIVSGYPQDSLETPEHKAFRAAYVAKFNDYPRLGAVVGYSAIKSLAAGIKKAGGTDTEKLIAAFKGLKVDTPFGEIVYRPQDNQSTMGAYIGKLKNTGDKGIMVDYHYVDGATVQPSDEEVKKMRGDK
ncbi:ABC transporter substrate-binding protein [Azoarcus indigens]|uniref:Amino acid/amide ABC transporter substrate-binding protein (HAAT family) n=1 Tax=Azoarcus indigens TaxID=29545 RepID=A0A4R6DMP8_9RHOO|nr:ABC transporter substrate-binding protein [Azoarcus indigens]NMG65769.1 ABC transporter substrate-binding protein [Azoarcus indigens]TDN46127.1 amino acid/amide ABC transporter substrate-binding protein (HAAT family) [Azoarcus indigens]